MKIVDVKNFLKKSVWSPNPINKFVWWGWKNLNELLILGLSNES